MQVHTTVKLLKAHHHRLRDLQTARRIALKRYDSRVSAERNVQGKGGGFPPRAVDMLQPCYGLRARVG